MATVKLLETRKARDVTILAFIAWFLLYAALLRDQGLLQLPWLAGSAFLTTVALMRVHAGSNGATTQHLAARSGALVAYGLRGNAWRSTDQGASWARLDTGLQASISAALELDGGELALLAQTGELLRSRDGGSSFAKTRFS